MIDEYIENYKKCTSDFKKCINDAKVQFIDYPMISECTDHVSDDHDI